MSMPVTSLTTALCKSGRRVLTPKTPCLCRDDGTEMDEQSACRESSRNALRNSKIQDLRATYLAYKGRSVTDCPNRCVSICVHLCKMPTAFLATDKYDIF
jgi:hypothetical protein